MLARLSLVSLLTLGSALAGEYPALDAYFAAATKLVPAVKAARSGAEISQLESDSRSLAALGAPVMELYAGKNPSCAAQLGAMLEEIPTMETRPLAEVRARYHNAVGLPAGPRHCYYGRSLVVHPIMSAMKIKSGWKETMRASVLHEAEEVVEHVETIRKNLDNPPN